MKKILLVEDDPFLIDIYMTKLKESGYEVENAPTGEDAVRKVKEEAFDLVLLDIVMPGIDGWDILKEIRAESKLDGLKVVIISNLSQKEEVEKGIKMGAIKYLIKANYTPSQVVEEIKSVF